MVSCSCLDLGGDSKFGHFLGNKLVSILAGFIQLALWVTTLMNFIIQPDSVKQTIKNLDTASYVLSVLLTLVIVLFSGLLLFALFKDRKGYIKCYLIFNMVLTTLFVVTFFINLFVQPKKFGVGGFFGVIIIIALNMLFFFIIRNYYVSFLRKKTAINPA